MGARRSSRRVSLAGNRAMRGTVCTRAFLEASEARSSTAWDEIDVTPREKVGRGLWL